MNEDAKRRILTLVAEGQLSPSDAAEQLATLESPTESPTDSSTEHGAVSDPPIEFAAPRPAPDATDEPRPAPGAVRRIKVVSTAQSVVVQADPNVREAEAKGRYESHYEGDTLVITSEIDWDGDDDSFGGGFGPPGFRINRVPGGDWRAARVMVAGQRGFARARHMIGETLVVRMNPDLALEAEVAAGSLNVSGIAGPVKANVAAGSMKIDGFKRELNVDVAAGSFKGQGRLDSGSSRINSAMGSVKLDLEAGSSVRITAESNLGSIKLPGRNHKSDKGPFGIADSQETTIGSGRGHLHIESSMGSVKIAVDGMHD